MLAHASSSKQVCLLLQLVDAGRLLSTEQAGCLWDTSPVDAFERCKHSGQLSGLLFNGELLWGHMGSWDGCVSRCLALYLLQQWRPCHAHLEQLPHGCP
jgi:hypothetical protein